MLCVGDGRYRRIGHVVVLYLCWQSRLTFASTFDNSTNNFVERCRVDCSRHEDFFSCGKYRVVRWLHYVAIEKEFSYGPFRVVRIPYMATQTVLPKFPQSRLFKSGAIETLNFVRDTVEDFVTKRAVVYTIDNSMSARNFGSAPMIMDEDEFNQMRSRKEKDGEWRLFKKKKSMILPVLILLNLLKLKLLLLPIFLGVHFIKKLLVLASLLAPSIFAHLKICKVAPPVAQVPAYHAWATAAEGPADYPTGYSQDEAWTHRNDFPAGLSFMGFHGYRNPYG